MPKSSIDNRTPRARTRSTTLMTASASSIITLSVISRHRFPGSTPGPLDAPPPVVRRGRVARAGAPRGSPRRRTAARARSASRAASSAAASRTQRPSSTTSPVSSASGTNSSGSISPRSGCCQRTSASAPTQRASRKRHDRLEEQQELAALERAVQVVLGRVADHGAGAHRLVEHLDAAATRLLGVVHRGVGVAEQLLGSFLTRSRARSRRSRSRRSRDAAARRTARQRTRAAARRSRWRDHARSRS